MKNIAESWEDSVTKAYVTDTIETFETISKNFLAAIVSSIDYDRLQQDLHDWLVDIVCEEAAEEEEEEEEEEQKDEKDCSCCKESSARYAALQNKTASVIDITPQMNAFMNALADS